MEEVPPVQLPTDILDVNASLVKTASDSFVHKVTKNECNLIKAI